MRGRFTPSAPRSGETARRGLQGGEGRIGEKTTQRGFSRPPDRRASGSEVSCSSLLIAPGFPSVRCLLNLVNYCLRAELPWMVDPQNQGVSVLVVEDEHLVRMDTASSLEAAGFRVFEAENAAEAIRCLELHNEIRLIFTDINMPGSMDGLALARYVRGRWPPVKIIVTSGYVKLRDSDLPSGALFIEKPYYPNHIAHKMSDLLAA